MHLALCSVRKKWYSCSLRPVCRVRIKGSLVGYRLQTFLHGSSHSSFRLAPGSSAKELRNGLANGVPAPMVPTV